MSNHGQLAAEQSAARVAGVPGETIAAVGPLEKLWLSQSSMAVAEKRDKCDEAADQKPPGAAANGSSPSCSGILRPPESEGNSSAKSSHDADRADASRSAEVTWMTAGACKWLGDLASTCST